MPSATSGASAPASPPAEGTLVTYEIPPSPGPVKPFRGEMTEYVYLRDGLVSMYFEMRNIGEEPITWLNTLYDYEPQQLYTPVVRLEWQEGGNAVYTRAGRFFPSPAVMQPGETAVYLMAGQPVQGSGTAGDLVSHIKYCPTRGMDDVPGIPLEVSDLSWSAGADGSIQASGTLTDTQGSRRQRAPQVGVAFFDANGAFIGAVVDPSEGEPLQPNGSRSFSVSGGGVAVDQVASAKGFAVIP